MDDSTKDVTWAKALNFCKVIAIASPIAKWHEELVVGARLLWQASLFLISV